VGICVAKLVGTNETRWEEYRGRAERQDGQESGREANEKDMRWVFVSM
jgi:hypothetical protein